MHYKDLRFPDYFKVSDSYTFSSRGKKVHKEVHFYLAESLTNRIRLSGEHDGYGWFLHRDAARLLKHKNLVHTLKKAYDVIQRKGSQTISPRPAR